MHHEILRFLTPILRFFTKFFFANLKRNCGKTSTFLNILQKLKSKFFANIYHSPFDSHSVLNIEAPYSTHCQNSRLQVHENSSLPDSVRKAVSMMADYDIITTEVTNQMLKL
jgi:hypothetical protein